MSSDIRTAFLLAPFERRLEMISDPTCAADLTTLLGPRGYEEYRGLIPTGRANLAGPTSEMVFVPGVMGSLLLSRGLTGVWWIDVRTRNHLNDLRLAPSGLADSDRRADL